jgi:hypothetical protein
LDGKAIKEKGRKKVKIQMEERNSCSLPVIYAGVGASSYAVEENYHHQNFRCQNLYMPDYTTF